MNPSGDISLWREVLYQAVQDALLGIRDVKGITLQKYETHHARLWLTKPNPDFDMVVSLADLDPVAVRQALRKKIAAAPSIDELFSTKPTSRKTLNRSPRLRRVGAPGVGFDFAPFVGTGDRTFAQDGTEIDSQEHHQ